MINGPFEESESLDYRIRRFDISLVPGKRLWHLIKTPRICTSGRTTYLRASTRQVSSISILALSLLFPLLTILVLPQRNHAANIRHSDLLCHGNTTTTQAQTCNAGK